MAPQSTCLVECSQFSLFRVATRAGWDSKRRLHPISGGGFTVANCEEPTGELVGQEWSGSQPDCHQRSTDDVHHEHLRVLVSRSPCEDIANPDLLGDQAKGHMHQQDQAQTELYEPHQAPSPFGTVNPVLECSQ